MDCERARNTLLQQVQTLPFYDGAHYVRAFSLGREKLWVGYADSLGSMPQGIRLDMNLEEDIAYLVMIHLPLELRGKGFGSQFYAAAEQTAHELGCTSLLMDASGKTPRGESRVDYLLRKRGYEIVKGITVAKTF